MVGTTLKHYRIVSLLGQGGMGSVYVAEDTELGREIALKVLPAEWAGDPDRLQRFKQEARAVAALNHPNIVTVHSVEEADTSTGSVHFITMELVRGRPLTELIEAEGLPAKRLLELAVPLTRAVAGAHKQGITHRDLKPDNVMVDDEGGLKVLDFGLAKLDPALSEDAGATVTAEGRILGTIAYMSPEQAQGKSVGPASDVFSLGIMLYEMATGRRPFEGDNNVSILTSILRDTPRPVSDSSPRPLGHLDEIVGRCLRKEPAERYETAEGLSAELGELQTALVSGDSAVSLSRPAARRVRPGSGRRALRFVAVLAVVAAIAGAAWWFIDRNAHVRWARHEAIPRIEQLLEESSWLTWGTKAWQAHELALEAARYIGDDPSLQQAWSSVSREVSLTSEPPGATIYAKAYADVEGDWREVGRTPLEAIRFPAGMSRVRAELAGHGPAHDLIFNIGFFGDAWHFDLQPEGRIPEEMVLVQGGEPPLMLPGIDHLEAEPTTDFLIDRFEVTQRRYKEFMDAGGYTNPDYWLHLFVDGARTLTFEEAMERFRDATGRPGPAHWEVGDYPDGEDDLPVSGISWFEAEAYARFAGKRLPTLFHWNQVAVAWTSGEVVPLANFDGDGPHPVGSGQAMNRYGAFDLAGNVREWCENGSTRDNQRFILGGGWNDEGWAFNDAYAQSPWDRSQTNGFRCMRYLNPGDERAELSRTIEMPFRDFYAETPVSDEVFELYLRQYEYDRTPLNARIESEDEQSDWTRQRVSFDAAYGGERVEAWLYVPRTPEPHPTVIVFPGSGAIHRDSSAGLTGERYSFLLKSGRAVIFPIYKGTYERGDELDSDYPEETNFYKDHVVMWAKDLARSIDYLETREEMDTSQLAYVGYSWGGVMGSILPAVEDRIKINLLYVAGLLFQRALAEADQINYVSRVRQPTLMVNGEFDFFFPVETSQKPLYDLLGTPEGDKKYVVYPGSHSVPRKELVREFLDWLDRYQGAR